MPPVFGAPRLAKNQKTFTNMLYYASNRDMFPRTRHQHSARESLLRVHPFLHANILIPAADTRSAHHNVIRKWHEKGETQGSQSKWKAGWLVGGGGRDKRTTAQASRR